MLKLKLQYFSHLMQRADIGKDPDPGKDGRQEKRVTEDEMVGWHHRLKGHQFEHTPEDGEGQGSLVCYSPWGHKELDVTEQLNNSNKFSSSVALATFEVPSSHRGLMVSMLGSAEIECSQHPCKFY